MDRLDAMRLFLRIAERGSFSAAARDMKIKQSTASKWVAALELELGVGLLERTTRALQLTDAGRTFSSHGRDVLAGFDALTHALAEQSPEPTGRIRMTVPVVFGRLFVVDAVAVFLREYPKVSVELSFDDRYLSLVDDGFDLAIRVGVPTDTSSRMRKLGESRRIVVASPEYLAARGRPRAPKDLAQHECLVHGDVSAPTIWRFAGAGGKDVPVKVGGRVAANNSEAVLALARGGFGIALLADWLVSADVRSKSLTPLLAAYEAPAAPILALTPPSRHVSPAVRLLTDKIAASLASTLPRASRRGVAPFDGPRGARPGGPTEATERRAVSSEGPSTTAPPRAKKPTRSRR